LHICSLDGRKFNYSEIPIFHKKFPEIPIFLSRIGNPKLIIYATKVGEAKFDLQVRMICPLISTLIQLMVSNGRFEIIYHFKLEM
jgi:hypothetical protein